MFDPFALDVTRGDVTVRPMVADEVQAAVDWAADEGWNPGINDAEAFFRADRKGFFVVLLLTMTNRASGTNWDNRSNF